MPFPFEVPFAELDANLDTYVDAIFGALSSEFLTLPKGNGFIEYPVFEQGYEALEAHDRRLPRYVGRTGDRTCFKVPVAFIVLRSMLGFTPPEWAYVATQRSGVEVPQGAAPDP